MNIIKLANHIPQKKLDYFIKKQLFVVSLLSIISVLPFSVDAAPKVFGCGNIFYQSIDTKLMELDPVSGNYSQVGVASAATYNAIGWDRRNNHVYGYRKADKTLFWISTTGATEDLGIPTKLGSPSITIDARSQAADMDADGNLWVYDRFHANSLYKINVDTLKY